MYSKNTFCHRVCNDGGSHVETSSICAVPLLWALYRLVTSSGVIYYVGESGAALVTTINSVLKSTLRFRHDRGQLVLYIEMHHLEV